MPFEICFSNIPIGFFKFHDEEIARLIVEAEQTKNAIFVCVLVLFSIKN